MNTKAQRTLLMFFSMCTALSMFACGMPSEFDRQEKNFLFDGKAEMPVLRNQTKSQPILPEFLAHYKSQSKGIVLGNVIFSPFMKSKCDPTSPPAGLSCSFAKGCQTGACANSYAKVDLFLTAQAPKGKALQKGDLVEFELYVYIISYPTRSPYLTISLQLPSAMTIEPGTRGLFAESYQQAINDLSKMSPLTMTEASSDGAHTWEGNAPVCGASSSKHFVIQFLGRLTETPTTALSLKANISVDRTPVGELSLSLHQP